MLGLKAYLGSFTMSTSIGPLLLLAFSIHACSAFCSSSGPHCSISTSVLRKEFVSRHQQSASTSRGGVSSLDQQSLGFPYWKSNLATGQILGALILFSSTVWTYPGAAAMAADSETLFEDVTILNHNYVDTLHPQCTRTIQVDIKGETFHYTGTRVGSKDDPILRGCSPREIESYGLRTESFDGQIINPGLRLIVGDGVREGRWEPANSAVTTPKKLRFQAVDGIRWNDGNKWIVKDDTPKPLTTVLGEWIFLAYIGFSTLAGSQGIGRQNSGKDKEIAPLAR